MSCLSALSTERNSPRAFTEVLDRVAAGLDAQTADLAVAFVSAHHAEALDELVAGITSRGLARHLLACTGEAIVGRDQEIEGTPAVSLWTIRLPGVRITPVRLSTKPGQNEELEAALAGTTSAEPHILALFDPFSFPTDAWLKTLNERSPAVKVIGGMASSGQMPGQNRLALDDHVFSDGGVAVLLDGSVGIRTVVSQGCRPVGKPMIVTRATENVIQELGRKPSLEVLKETFETLEPAEQDLVRGGLHIGRVINEYQDAFGRGDFLVRNVIGADESGALAVTDRIRVGTTVQFHVRDAETADEDLWSLLSASHGSGPIRGALLFTCNGRGTRLFPQPNHDVAAIEGTFGPIPVAGFFAMGELGPIGGQNFIHGFTASIALFEEPSPEAEGSDTGPEAT